MIYCENKECGHCCKHYTGQLVCALPTVRIFPTCGSQMNRYVLCGSYIEKDDPQIPELQPGRDKDGFYPGQYRRKK